MAGRNGVKRCAVDVDDVKVDFVTGFINFINTNHPDFWKRAGRATTRNDFKEYRLSHFLKCTPDEERELVLDFYDSDELASLLPMDGAVEGVFKLKKMGYELTIVTSRAQSIRARTETWIERHFPGMYNDFYFSSGASASDQPRTKGEICRHIGARYLIDDSPNYAKSALEHGVSPVIMAAPWNLHMKGAEGMHYAENWKEVVKHIGRNGF